MSVQMNGVGVGSPVQAAQYVRRTAPVDAAAESKETQEAQASKKVDTYEARGEEGVSYKGNPELVKQLKAELEQQQSRFLTSVKDMLTKQGIKVAEGDGIWKQIASGKFEADAETVAAAKKEISDGGYWSVEKTSERFIQYAKALTGGDPSKAEKMREAFVKGYKAAEKAWGGSLPELSQKTYDATMKLFDEWANEGKTAA